MSRRPWFSYPTLARSAHVGAQVFPAICVIQREIGAQSAPLVVPNCSAWTGAKGLNATGTQTCEVEVERRHGAFAVEVLMQHENTIASG